MGFGRRMRLLAPVAWASAAVAVAVVLLARLLLVLGMSPAAGVASGDGAWALLAAAALLGAGTLGGAGLWHALMLARLVRIRGIDRLIAALGAGVAVLGAVVVIACALEPALGRALLAAAAPLWLAGLAAAALALAMVVHARGARTHPAPGTVLVLGAGLRGRDVGPLLRRRVERGAEEWRAALAERPDARLVVSGGQGPDEVRTEASAMAEHLVERCGVPPEAIDLEDASRSTRENLALSRPLVGVPGRAPLVVVTSEYHAYRTAWLLAEAGLDGTVVGAWTRPSYRPGATLREALAIAADLRWWCAAGALAAWALAIGLLLAT
ncbi:YdcF family protein [Agrococcus terreus]|uniref:YdcF family protein n=1 Tax=Agrococcus terreus TaxID=574649 RepID=UPI00384BD489